MALQKANNRSTLQKRIDVLNQKLTKASSRLALVADDMVEIVQDSIRELRVQRDAFQAQLEATRLPHNRRLLNVDSTLDAAIKLVTRLREALQTAEIPKLRKFLQQAIDSSSM